MKHVNVVSRILIAGAFAGSIAVSLPGCSPEVKIQAPDKPIVINLNVKIEQEVRVKIEKDIDDLFRNKKGIF